MYKLYAASVTFSIQYCVLTVEQELLVSLLEQNRSWAEHSLAMCRHGIQKFPVNDEAALGFSSESGKRCSIPQLEYSAI